MKIVFPALLAALMALPTAHALAANPAEKAAAVQPAKARGVWIDVRSAEEFKAGHLQGALNISADEIASKIKSISPDKNAPVNLYCRSGRRAEAALQILKKEGYTNVRNHGGYDDLVKKGLK